jgi:hypothetical protein
VDVTRKPTQPRDGRKLVSGLSGPEGVGEEVGSWVFVVSWRDL